MQSSQDSATYVSLATASIVALVLLALAIGPRKPVLVWQPSSSFETDEPSAP